MTEHRKLRQPTDPLYQALRQGRTVDLNRQRNPREALGLSVRLGTRLRYRKP